ncbi:MAG: transglutaminase-like domain-containing protein [Bacteroidota bacterium]
MENSELKALITLLDDPNHTVYTSVKKRLIEIGAVIVPELKNAWENSKDELFLERTSAIISDVQFDDTLSRFKNWVDEGGENLLDASFLIAKFNFPDLEYHLIGQKIEKIKRDAWLQMNDNLTPLEQIRVINHIIYNIHKFGRNNTDFYSPKNSYINQVLETKKGNPISLAILYLIITEKLGLPVYGVNLPKNFILAYAEELYDSALDTDIENKIVSFYINPYNNGAVLTKREIDYFLKQQKIKTQDFFYRPCDTKTIIQRLLLNLIYSYERKKNSDKVEDLKKFTDLFDNPLPNVSY